MYSYIIDLFYSLYTISILLYIIEQLKQHVAGGALNPSIVQQCEQLVLEWTAAIEILLADKFDEK